MRTTVRIRLATALATILIVAGCSSDKIVFIYPDEAVDFRLRNLGTPALHLGKVTDMRPLEQREGQGKFFHIVFPKDTSWEVPATQIYAEALAQDLEQTHLFELVPLRGQADYALTADLLAMGCELNRSPAAFLLPAALGAGAGMAFGDTGSDRIKLATMLAAVAVVAVPVPTATRAEAEVRLTLENAHGDIVWQRACLGEFEGRKFMTATSRQDQELVDEYLTKAVKRANACLLGQLRQFLLDEATPGS